jgi:tetratricopeptide (TPR) repeat protein
MTMPTIPEILQTALQHHQAGRLPEAEALYRQVLQVQPDQPTALHYLGVIAHQIGKHEAAVQYIAQALQLNPHDVDGHNNIGEAYRALGRVEEAMAHYRQALALQPSLAEAHNNLGNLLRDQGKLEEAVASYRQALALKPWYAEGHVNLGMAFQEQGKLDEAIGLYRHALALKPAYAEAHFNLGVALQQQGMQNDAIEHYRSALSLTPSFAAASYNLGNAFQLQGKLDEAIACYLAALRLNPGHAEAHNNVGNALQKQGRLDEAIAHYVTAIGLKPDDAVTRNNLGHAFHAQGKRRKAIEQYRRALSLNPHFADAHVNYSLTLLLTGKFREGWKEYEWRWDSGVLEREKRPFPQPLWDGSKIAGRTILLHAEQGMGDTLQFIRYAPLVAKRGAKVIVECQPEMKELLASVEGVTHLAAKGEPLPDFDVHAPLMRLPLAFGTTLETIPARVPYISINPKLARVWRDRVRPAKSAFKVGLAWAGRPGHVNDRNRSSRLGDFLPLAKVRGVAFYSLQKGEAARETAAPPDGMAVIDETASLNDFADTAALISNLDLVICVDTAVAHLAGAMGKSVWLVLPFVPDWRWLLDREDTPWYPTMKLFRQQRPGDWQSVFRRVAETLQVMVKGPPERGRRVF